MSWNGPGGRRDVDITINASALTPQATLKGEVPGPGSAAFHVSDAWNRTTDAHWRTLNGAKPGQPEGPLYFNFDWDALGSTVYIWGYLVRK